MICFKDMTYCQQYRNNKCINHTCYRAFKVEDEIQAIMWWGGTNFSLSISDMKTEDCGFIGKNND